MALLGYLKIVNRKSGVAERPCDPGSIGNVHYGYR